MLASNASAQHKTMQQRERVRAPAVFKRRMSQRALQLDVRTGQG